MKMSKNFDNLNEAFGLDDESIVPIKAETVEEPKVVEAEVSLPSKPKPERIEKDDITKDYEYTRGNLYSLIEKGQEAINGILELAEESEMPRAYEVAGQLIKNVADATDKLLDLQKKLKDVEEETVQRGPTTVNNSLFVGSTAELSKLLKKKAENEDE